MSFNYEQSQVDGLGYTDGTGYALKIQNRDRNTATKWLSANAHQVARIGSILAEGSEDENTSARDVHIRHAQYFADILHAMNVRDDGTNAAVDAYAAERSDEDGHPVTAYAHVRAAIRWAIAQFMPEYADQVMEALLDGGSVAHCVKYVEKANRHRLSLADAEKARGCWVEGSRGWTGGGVLVAKAQELGMELDADDSALAAHYTAGETVDLALPSGATVAADVVSECMEELTDRTEAWLNEHVAPEGWSFGWNDGEFYLWPDVDWEAFGN